MPIYELLEQRAITPYLVNGRHVKMGAGPQERLERRPVTVLLHSR